MALKYSQSNLIEHSEVKVKLLGTYLDRYLNILNTSSYVGDVHYYDLFCGMGEYDNGKEGSPLIALRAMIKSFYSEREELPSKSFFYLNFNDIDNGKVEHLKQKVKMSNLRTPKIREINYTNDDYQKLLPEVTRKLKTINHNERAFVFIDPYGYKEIRMSNIKELLENKKTEVLLFLPTHFMFRFRENGTPESLIELINEIVPEDKWPKSTTGLEFIDSLKSYMKDYLGNKYFVDSFAISRSKNQFFCLFFFTSHIYGFDRMIDAKWVLDKEDGRGWKYQAENDLFSQVENNANTQKLEKALDEFLKEPKSNGQVYEFTLRQGYKVSHTTDILKNWQSKGLVTIKDKEGKNARKNSFYLNYKSYNKAANKVYFTKK